MLMIAIGFNLQLGQCIIRSTDSDILCIAYINKGIFIKNEIRIVIQSNQIGAELKYIDVNQLFKCFNEDKDLTLSILRNRSMPLGVVYGIVHFLSGCDYLPHLRVFTKNACCQAVLKFGKYIFPDQIQFNNPQFWTDECIDMITMNFHLALYYHKYAQCFASGDATEFWKK